MAPAGDRVGEPWQAPTPEPAEPVCGLSASEGSVCLLSCKLPSVPHFTEGALLGILNKALLSSTPSSSLCLLIATGSGRRLPVDFGNVPRTHTGQKTGAQLPLAAPVLQAGQRGWGEGSPGLLRLLRSDPAQSHPSCPGKYECASPSPRRLLPELRVCTSQLGLP